MLLKEDIEDYRQPDGLIVPKSEKPGIENPDTTGDGIKHFSMYHALLVKRGESRIPDYNEFEIVLRSCYSRWGVPHRSKTKTQEQTSKDVLVSASYAAKFMNSKIAYEILNAGNKYRFGPFKWFYPNLFPELFEYGFLIPLKIIFTRRFWKAWMGKNPEIVTHLQWAGLPRGHRPHFLRIVYQAFYFCIVGVKHSGLNSLNKMMAETAYGKSALLDICINFWEWRLGLKWKSGFVESLTNELEPQHPIVRYWK